MERKYKKLIIVSCFFVLLAIVLLLVGGHLAGWDILAWFDIRTSKYFQWTLVAVASIILVIIMFLAQDYYNKHMRR